MNNNYLNPEEGYLTNENIEMIDDRTTWYLGFFNLFSYKYAKYTNDNMLEYAPGHDAKVGLLRYGELMAGQFDINENNTDYWTLTTHYSSSRDVTYITKDSHILGGTIADTLGIKPALNLKQNVIITGGLGTKEQPFELELAS